MIQKPDTFPRTGKQKSPPPSMGSRLEAGGSSAESEAAAFDAPVQCRLEHPLDFGTQAEPFVGIADAIVIAGVRDQRPDHVHDVDHALDLRAVIHVDLDRLLDVVIREALVAVELLSS